MNLVRKPHDNAYMCMFLLFIFDNMPLCTCCRWKTSEYICSLKNTQPLVIISTRKLILRSIYALHQVRHTCWVKECVGYSSFMSYVLHLKREELLFFWGQWDIFATSWVPLSLFFFFLMSSFWRLYKWSSKSYTFSTFSFMDFFDDLFLSSSTSTCGCLQ